MVEFIRELRERASSIIQEARKNSYEAAKSLANEFGYSFEGLSNEDVAHFSRDIHYNFYDYEKSVDDLKRSLKVSGFELQKFNIPIESRVFDSYIITRTYRGAGGAPTVQDAADLSKCIVSIIYDNKKMIIGLPFDISEQHMDLFLEVAGKFKMEPKKQISKDESELLGRLLGDMEINL